MLKVSIRIGSEITEIMEIRVSHQKRVLALAITYIVLGTTRASAAEETNNLEEIVVTGRNIENYMAVDALTGTKTNTLLRSASFWSKYTIEGPPPWRRHTTREN